MGTDGFEEQAQLYFRGDKKDEWVPVSADNYSDDLPCGPYLKGEGEFVIPTVLQEAMFENDIGTKRRDLFSWKNEFAMTFNIKQKRKLSRKKFKKYLMGQGFSRDIAEWLCWYIGMFQGAVSRKEIYRTMTDPMNPLVRHDGFTPREVFATIAMKGAKEWITNTET